MHPTLGTSAETSQVFPKSITLRVTRVPSCGKNWELHARCNPVPSLEFSPLRNLGGPAEDTHSLKYREIPVGNEQIHHQDRVLMLF